MESLESKKLALLRIWQILQKYSDCDHPLTQDEIVDRLDKDYGIIIERKAVGRNISLLKEAKIDIESTSRDGCYLATREFEDTELRLLIDSVLCSQHINPKHSADLIEKLCNHGNKYFRSCVKNIHTVNDWNKTENAALFFNIEMVDTAIEQGKQLQYDYNKYGIDKNLHKSSFQRVTPYQLILHNQKYYLMAYSSYWGNMVFHRLDRISNIRLYDQPAQQIREIPGYESGIDYKKISSTMPYMYTDEPERITFLADVSIIDQIIDWFGKDVAIRKTDDENKVDISLWASPNAMEHWATQYINYVEVTSPAHLRNKICEDLQKATEKYAK
jgi:predicted DNA-binding transcriptional regulator YafY